MKLSKWIQKIGGRTEAAMRLNVTPGAVHYWLTGRATPKWSTIYRIVELSHGAVSQREIFEETKLRERATGRRKA